MRIQRHAYMLKIGSLYDRCRAKEVSDIFMELTNLYKLDEKPHPRNSN